MKKYILVLDQGTTSSRSIIFDYAGQVVSQANKEFKQFYPQPGWVEHDPEEILASQLFTINEVLKQSGVAPEEIAAIGITNQRETTVLWDKKTGKPLHKAIVWQCRRSKDICESLKADGFAEKIKSKTGLVTDAYFSGTKVKWLLDHYPEIRKMAENGEVAFGTIDSWLLYNLTGGKAHLTDYSNASRTLLFNINTLEWDQEILDKLGIPASILPEVRSSSEIYGYLDKKIIAADIPISGIAGDQQAALFGQTCFNKGDSKNTYGTGCFILLNTGEEPVYSESGLLTSIAWGLNGKVNYILEGSIFIGGAVIQWLRDELGIISQASESEELAMKVSGNDGVYFVPAFTGLGTPYWNMDARGTIRGLTRGSNRNHLVRSALEAISYQTGDVIECMKNEANISGLNALRVDGGASVNNFLMQFQADLLNIPVERPKVVETTALGAAYLAGLAVGFWQSPEEIRKNHEVEKVFQPTTEREKMDEYYAGWKMAIKSVT